MTQDHNAYAFISYVRENKTDVERLARDLRFRGVKIWLDKNDILPGQDWRYAIEDAIKRGAFFIACYSQELCLRQETVMHGELRLAIDRLRNMPKDRVWFIPVLINEAEIPSHNISSHETLKDIHTVKLYEGWDDGIENILRAMNLSDPHYRRALHLIELINHHPRERAHAISSLDDKLLLGREDISKLILPVVINSVKDNNENVRKRAVEVLGSIGPGASDATPNLIAALKDDNEDVWKSAARALGRVGPAAAEAVPILMAAIVEDRAWDVQKAAIWALGRIGPAAAEAIPVLVIASESMEDEYYGSNVRFEAVEALHQIGLVAKEDAEYLKYTWSNRETWIEKGAAWVLRHVSSPYDPILPLSRALKCPKFDVRMIAAELLGAIGAAAAPAVPSLIVVLKDPEEMEKVRIAATAALVNIGAASLPALTVMLGDPQESARRAAAEVLGEMGSTAAETAPLLRAAVKDRDKNVRKVAILTLRQIGAKGDDVQALMDALNDPEIDVRKAAAEVLGSIEPAAAEAVPVLITALGDLEEKVRVEAAVTLGKIGTPSVSALTAALRDPEIREESAYALGWIGPAAAEAVPALTSILDDRDRDIRRTAVWALGQIGSAAAEAAPDLINALRDRKKDVRAEAAQALGKIGPVVGAVPALSAALDDDNETVCTAAVEALCKFGPTGIPALIAALADLESEVRNSTIGRALMNWPEAQDIPGLRAAYVAAWTARANAEEKAREAFCAGCDEIRTDTN